MIDKIKQAFAALKIVAEQLPAILKEIQSIREQIAKYQTVLDTLTKQVNDIKGTIGRFKF